MAVSIFYIQSIVYIQSIGKRLKKIVFNQAGEMLVASAALFCSVLSYCWHGCCLSRSVTRTGGLAGWYLVPWATQIVETVGEQVGYSSAGYYEAWHETTAKNVSSCLQYEMQLQNVSLQHAEAPSSRYWAVSAVISNSHVDCWLLYICPKLWARQHNISSCESPGSCSTWGESSVKHYLLNPWMCMKRSWQVAASFPIMPPSLSRSNKNGEK